VLLVDKPAGPTSHDCVAGIRRRFNIRKVGHGGTLDPMATGLLIVLLGRGTKLSGLFIGSDKTYEGQMLLGVSTNSHDADGEITREAPYGGITREQVVAEIERRTGDQYQTPPMVSAVKVNGVPLYKSARKGREVEREPRLIHVYRFVMTGFDPPRVGFELDCTKGTYVRTLCSDIGDALGCGAHLAALRRTRSGKLDVADALPYADIMKMEPQHLLSRLLPARRFAPGSNPPDSRPET
jgi:tRNA pseudouridine55 synthase